MAMTNAEQRKGDTMEVARIKYTTIQLNRKYGAKMHVRVVWS